MNKQEARQWALSLRPKLECPQANASVVGHLKSFSEFHSSQHVLSYLGFRSEVDLDELHQMTDKTFYTTRTHAKPRRLSVHKMDPNQLEKHRFGYWQPTAESSEVDPQTIDLVLVPGLAYDRQGGRLGYGMGHYDRLLLQLKPTAIKIGVTYGSLLVATLPLEDHDIPMNYIVTDQGLVSVD